MPNPVPPATKAAVKNSYLNQGLSLQSAAARHGVSIRLVNKWSAAEGWLEAKEGLQPEPEQAQEQPEPPLEIPEGIEDFIEILDQAIARLSAAIHSPHDGRNRANSANALVKLIAQRCTLADTHERRSRRAAIELGDFGGETFDDTPCNIR